MIVIEDKLKNSYPIYADIIDRMIPVAQEIIDSEYQFEYMNMILPTLDAMDAYVLGIMSTEMMRCGFLR
jgi:hypothetical protein